VVMTRPPGARAIDEILAAARGRFRRPTPHQAFTELAGGAVLIDIRPAAERASAGEIPGSAIVERNHLEWRLDPCCDARLPLGDRLRPPDNGDLPGGLHLQPGRGRPA
jgi:hypothetical protein